MVYPNLFTVCLLPAREGRDQGHTVAVVQRVLEVSAALIEDDDAGQLLRQVKLAHQRLDGGALGKGVREDGLAAGGVLREVGLKLYRDLHIGNRDSP